MLVRFITAQEGVYEIALEEIRSGQKLTHWMWYIFPQMKGLGESHNAQFYGISDLKEAKTYLDHPLLGKRLREMTSALLKIEDRSIIEILGEVDAMKLKSSMTMFDLICPKDIFDKVLTRFFNSERCPRTIISMSKRKLFNALCLPMCVMLALIIIGILALHLELSSHGFQAIMLGLAFELILFLGFGFLAMSILGTVLTLIGYFKSPVLMFYSASIFSTYLFMASVALLLFQIAFDSMISIPVALLFWSGYLMKQTMFKVGQITSRQNKLKCIGISVGIFILSLLPAGVVHFVML